MVAVTTQYQYSVLLLFNDSATTEIYPLPRRVALPIFPLNADGSLKEVEIYPGKRYAGKDLMYHIGMQIRAAFQNDSEPQEKEDRKSTRLNSSHANISYAVFCLKKKQCLPWISEAAHGL